MAERDGGLAVACPSWMRSTGSPDPEPPRAVPTDPERTSRQVNMKAPAPAGALSPDGPGTSLALVPGLRLACGMARWHGLSGPGGPRLPERVSGSDLAWGRVNKIRVAGCGSFYS